MRFRLPDLFGTRRNAAILAAYLAACEENEQLRAAEQDARYRAAEWEKSADHYREDGNRLRIERDRANGRAARAETERKELEAKYAGSTAAEVDRLRARIRQLEEDSVSISFADVSPRQESAIYNSIRRALAERDEVNRRAAAHAAHIERLTEQRDGWQAAHADAMAVLDDVRRQRDHLQAILDCCTLAVTTDDQTGGF